VSGEQESMVRKTEKSEYSKDEQSNNKEGGTEIKHLSYSKTFLLIISVVRDDKQSHISTVVGYQTYKLSISNVRTDGITRLASYQLGPVM